MFDYVNGCIFGFIFVNLKFRVEELKKIVFIGIIGKFIFFFFVLGVD